MLIIFLNVALKIASARFTVVYFIVLCNKSIKNTKPIIRYKIIRFCVDMSLDKFRNCIFRTLMIYVRVVIAKSIPIVLKYNSILFLNLIIPKTESCQKNVYSAVVTCKVTGNRTWYSKPEAKNTLQHYITVIHSSICPQSRSILLLSSVNILLYSSLYSRII